MVGRHYHPDNWSLWRNKVENQSDRSRRGTDCSCGGTQPLAEAQGRKGVRKNPPPISLSFHSPIFHRSLLWPNPTREQKSKGPGQTELLHAQSGAQKGRDVCGRYKGQSRRRRGRQRPSGAEQQSPTFLAPQTGFMEENFFTNEGVGVVSWWFTLFQLLLHQLHLRPSGIRSQSWGPLGQRILITHGTDTPRPRTTGLVYNCQIHPAHQLTAVFHILLSSMAQLWCVQGNCLQRGSHRMPSLSQAPRKGRRWRRVSSNTVKSSAHRALQPGWAGPALCQKPSNQGNYRPFPPLGTLPPNNTAFPTLTPDCQLSAWSQPTNSVPMAGTVPRGLLADGLRQPPDQCPHCQALPSAHRGRIRTQVEAQAGYLKPQDARGVQREQELHSPDSWREGRPDSVSGVSPTSQPCISWGIRRN